MIQTFYPVFLIVVCEGLFLAETIKALAPTLGAVNVALAREKTRLANVAAS